MDGAPVRGNDFLWRIFSITQASQQTCIPRESGKKCSTTSLVCVIICCCRAGESIAIRLYLPLSASIRLYPPLSASIRPLSALCCRRVDPDPPVPQRLRADTDDEGRQQEVLRPLLPQPGAGGRGGTALLQATGDGRLPACLPVCVCLSACLPVCLCSSPKPRCRYNAERSGCIARSHEERELIAAPLSAGDHDLPASG